MPIHRIGSFLGESTWILYLDVALEEPPRFSTSTYPWRNHFDPIPRCILGGTTSILYLDASLEEPPRFSISTHPWKNHLDPLPGCILGETTSILYLDESSEKPPRSSTSTRPQRNHLDSLPRAPTDDRLRLQEVHLLPTHPLAPSTSSHTPAPEAP
ncbi:hypothetical protein KM043_010153 [Ampulex compressa]|nr:hypothetical protein KM043_010153 [Ampulex compressa]